MQTRAAQISSKKKVEGKAYSYDRTNNHVSVLHRMGGAVLGWAGWVGPDWAGLAGRGWARCWSWAGLLEQ